MKVLRGYIALILALLITVSAAGVPVSVHRCCGKIKNFTIFGDAELCNMAKGALHKAPAHSSKGAVASIPCCNNQTITLHNEVRASLEKNSTPQAHGFIAFIVKNILSSFLPPQLKIQPNSYFSGSHWLKGSLNILFRQFRI
ncbi:hypothetical protein [Arcticibacter sp. MXS-1]|uniref:HYC_CC_PP family protein n=1 Tax=Arcticibacter sp. MXS-1 TaxID=3341726 RepID=UPI0035A8BB41